MNEGAANSSVANSSVANSSAALDLDGLVIGAGFAGLYQLHCLRDRLGLAAIGVESGDGVGGTWHWNRYPGARCDSESYSYAYYFSDRLLCKWEWSERYPGYSEILRYLNFVADELDLKRSIRLGTRVTSAHYDEAANRWHVHTDKGDHFRSRYLISAVGCLSAANIPDIPGLDNFGGSWWHTGRWPHAGVDFTARRVGQIGTGSTGIQIAPVIAAEAGHLTIFQRTANYSVPARNAPLSAAFKRDCRERRDEIRQIIHSTPNGHPFRIAARKAKDVSDAERAEIYEAAWQKGGLQFRASFFDLMADKQANETAAAFIRNKITSIVKDPRTARILSDIDHPFAAKRPPLDNGYFEIFNRDNVTLVDLRARPIERITEKGILTADGVEHALDSIVFATGFDAMTGALLSLDIRGRGGLGIREAWANGPKTYLGLQIAGFPNLFTITGPGSPSVLSNMPVAIEQHVEWITRCIADMDKRAVRQIETTDEAAENWVRHVNEAADATLLATVKHSWYRGANIPGKPQVFMPYAGGLTRYRAICEDVVAKDYEGFVLNGAAPVGPNSGPNSGPNVSPNVSTEVSAFTAANTTRDAGI